MSMKVSRRDVEVGVGPIAYNPDFAQIVTYLTWFYTNKFAIFSANPQEVPKLLSLLYPLPPMVWLCFAGSILVLAIIKLMFLIMKNNTLQTVQIFYSTSRDARRIIIAMSLFTVFMFYIFYVNSLESHLVVKEYEQPIDTEKDLLNSRLRTYYPGKTAIAKFLLGYPSTIMRQIMKMQAEPFPYVGKIPSYVRSRLAHIKVTRGTRPPISFINSGYLTKQLCSYTQQLL